MKLLAAHLATVAGISQVSRSDMNAPGDHRRFTTLSARDLFSRFLVKSR